MLTYIIPTHDRPEELAMTLASIGKLEHARARAILGGVEVIVVDNASRFPVTAPPTLRNGLPVRVIYRPSNEAAGGRNAAAHSASGRGSNPDHWLLMLDDDSCPMDLDFVDALAQASPETAAVAAEIFLSPSQHALGSTCGPRRESGGLPEVFIGCGVAIRRSDFIAAGGYDTSFGYYAEEYDLCAKFLLAGRSIVWDRRFRVHHRKSAEGRDMNAILRCLVRNNACVAQRYTPESVCREEIDRIIERYRTIAQREHALEGYQQGLLDLYAIISAQPRRELSEALYERFTGLAHAREHLTRQLRGFAARRVAVVDPPRSAKHAHLVHQAAFEAGVEVFPVATEAEALALPNIDAVIAGTLSPGPMLDLAEQIAAQTSIPVLTPWSLEGVPASTLRGAA